MLLPLEDADYWAEKYNITKKYASCPKCGIEIVTDTPFAINGYRGLKSKDHGCGEKYTRKILVPVSKEEIEFWNGIT